MQAARVLERRPDRITFQVDDVEPAKSPLDEVKASEALATALGARPEACFSYTASVVRSPGLNPLLGAVHTAFSTHRPLVLSPDMIWLAAAQGIAQHVNADPERHRGRLVSHQGRETISIATESYARGSPENPWQEIVGSFAEAARARSNPQAHDLVVASFSTTGPVERTAYQVTLLDMLRSFFDYEIRCICGIPRVILEGTVGDWAEVRRRIESIDSLGLDLEWWTSRLVPVARELERAASGTPDADFWRAIYKLRSAYGGDTFSGWIGNLFPYVQDGLGRPVVRTPLLAKEGGYQIRPGNVPGGLACAPFRVVHSRDGSEDFLELVAGFVGFEQDQETLALRPRIGWAVRQQDALGRALSRFARLTGLVPPVARDEASEKIMKTLGSVPRELAELYGVCNGAVLQRVARIYGLDEIRAARDESRRYETDAVFGVLMTGEEICLTGRKKALVALSDGKKRRPLAASFGELLESLALEAARAGTPAT